MEEKHVKEIELDDVLPNRFQPRIKFNQEALTELANSIKEHGVIQPIIVREIGNKYEIIAGERRYKASVLAGKITIPAVVHNVDDAKSSEIALIENIQRQDLSPIEEAASYRKILELGSLTQQQLAEKVDKNQSTIANKLRLLNLSDEVQEALLNGKISERHARSLLKLEREAAQIAMLERVENERLTVRQLDVEIDKELAKGAKTVIEKEIEVLEDILEEKKDYNVSAEKHNPGFLDIDHIESNAADIYIEPVQKDWNQLLSEEKALEEEMKESLNAYGIDVNFDKNEKSVETGRFFNFEPIEKEETNLGSKQPANQFNFPFESRKPQAPKRIGAAVKEKIKATIEELKLTGTELEVEEIDSEDQYQYIIKIKKD